MKKFNLLLLSLITLTQTVNASFIDIDQHIFESSINKLQSLGIVEGFEDLTFRPNQEISRASALKISLFTNYSEQLQSPVSFSDVDESDWFYKYISFALNQGIINGYNDGTFKPGNDISVAESLKIMFEVEGISYTFQDGVDWYLTIKNRATELGYLNGHELLFQDVLRPITRAEFAYFYDKIITKTNVELSFNSSYENLIEVETLNADHFFKLENGGILLVYKDGFMSLEITNNNFENFEEGFQDFNNFSGMDITNSNFFSTNSKAFSGNNSYFERAFILDKNVFLDVKISKNSVLEDLINNTDLNIENIKRFEKFADLKNEINNNILVEGFSKNFLDKIDNKQIIYTDDIGIGLGPIDYIYLYDLNLTLKNERNSETIMQIKEGKNSDF